MVAATLVAALGVSLAACGGESKDSGTTKVEANQSSSVPANGRRGGALTFLAAADVDCIDPGLDYYQFGQAVQAAVNRTLYAYRPDDSVKPIPDLAEGPPEISADRKSVTVRIRRSVFFSPPVNREVKAQDVKYAFEHPARYWSPQPCGTWSPDRASCFASTEPSRYRRVTAQPDGDCSRSMTRNPSVPDRLVSRP